MQLRQSSFVFSAVFVGAVSFTSACGSSGTKSPDASGSTATETPPMGAAAVEAWLATGAYKSWSSETAIHEARSPSPHGFNRIYSNSIIAAAATGTDAWPVNASAVKELYASLTATTPFGYAVYTKTKADSAGGASWYWYERVPLDSQVPHDATTGVVADGMGGSGTAMTICVGCHSAAGSDAAHTPSVGGRDQVYTAVH
jgi:hypothetical protein